MQEEGSAKDTINISTPMAQMENLAIYMLSPQIIVDRIINDLRGLRIEDRNGELVWVQDTSVKAYLNEKGIAEMRSILNSYVNPNVFLSIFTEEEIYLKCRELAFKINDLFFLNWEDWDIKKENLSIIKEKIMMQIHASLNRAMRFSKEGGAYGMQLQALTQQYQVRETIVKGQEGKRLLMFRRNESEQ